MTKLKKKFKCILAENQTIFILQQWKYYMFNVKGYQHFDILAFLIYEGKRNPSSLYIPAVGYRSIIDFLVLHNTHNK
jgi:hypothetical protein